MQMRTSRHQEDVPVLTTILSVQICASVLISSFLLTEEQEVSGN